MGSDMAATVPIRRHSNNGASPVLIVPPGAVATDLSTVTWFQAQRALGALVHIPAGTYRYGRFRVGTSSGNIQFTVNKVTDRTATTVDLERSMDSGVIACPSAGSVRLDLGATALEAGFYAIALYVDNNTATIAHSSSFSAGLHALGLYIDSVTGLGTSGMPATKTDVAYGGRAINLSLEADDGA